MFDFNGNTKNSMEEEILKAKASKAAEKEVPNLLSELMLASDMPESNKTVIRIINTSSEINDLMSDVTVEVAFNDDNLNVENAKKYLLMIIAYHNQIKAFLESNPLTTNTEEEKHEADER